MIRLEFKNKNNIWHKKNGPAFIVSNGYIVYYYNGEWHREDGPAVIQSDGKISYWLNDKHYTKKNIIKN